MLKMILKHIRLVIFLLPLSFAVQQTNNTTAIEKLEDALYKGFADVWPFIKQFPTVSDLRMERLDLYEGIANEGPWTEYSLQKIIQKALNGEKISVLIVGESISAGANLGCRNNRRTYHYGLVMWWLKTITLATGSRLRRHQVVVGGVATNYFDRCWKEYVHKNETFDLVLWEFSFNDATAINQSKSLERFTISIAKLHKLPGLLFVSFFRKNFFENYVLRKKRNPCDKVVEEIDKRHEKHEISIDSVASYYGVTVVDLERAVCSALRRNSSSLTIQHMFNTDHPSYLAHAQMTFILIHYFRGNFANIVKKMKLEQRKEGDVKVRPMSGFKRKLAKHKLTEIEKEKHATKLNLTKDTRMLPPPLYLSKEEASFSDEPICWTAILPNIHIKPKHDLFDLKAEHSPSFKKITKMDWRDADEERSDSTGGYFTNKTNQTISFDFKIPSLKDQTKWRVSLAIRNKFYGGDVEVSLRDCTKRKRDTECLESTEISKDIIDSSAKTYSGVNVYDLSKKTTAGKKLIRITTLTGGIHICGIIIS